MTTVARYEDWISARPLASIGTNAGSAALPFQTWKPFKEAFAPEVLRQVKDESRIDVKTILDPFLGSGTTALAAQFLGIHPLGMEVNPYLADLASAKCESYDIDLLTSDYEDVITIANAGPDITEQLARLPRTFVAPGVKDRYIYARSTAAYILQLSSAIENLKDAGRRRLLRVLLGGILIEVSNIRVSGKGRRYRSNWQATEKSRVDVARAFAANFQTAVSDIIRFGNRECLSYTILNGDSRDLHDLEHQAWDASLFSPPYPNSFDYTDVYNIELWMLGYLTHPDENTRLRHQTLTSHVQVKRKFSDPPTGSKTLDDTLERLEQLRPSLWNRHIPEMVGAYFTDLLSVLANVRRGLSPQGSIWLVVGNSQYGDCLVDVPTIISELGASVEVETRKVDAFRSMRRSPQQGGRPELYESLIVLDSC